MIPELCPAAKSDWFFPDMYLPDLSDGVSHEALCVLNVGREDAHITLTLYFEDADCMDGFHAVCPGSRTNHIRLDKIRGSDGTAIPQCRPYAGWLHSDVPVLCQYTRVDAALPDHALMTAMGL